ncbi:MAG: NADH-quinone oxidoreductase subunit L [Phycisphaerales bacterium]|nr:NADH-quinone oxidoreductase subunit L [Phycisphaerales bacterium]
MTSLSLHAASLAAMASDQASAAVPAAVAAPQLAWAGWILWLPLLSTIACCLCAAFRVRGKAPAVITVAALAGSFALTLALYGKVQHGPVRIHLFDWIDLSWGSGAGINSLTANFALYIDSLTLIWMLFVTPLGTLIALYASEYMEGDLPARGGRGYARFFAGVSIFLFAMGSLVMADNLVMLYLGWEGVGFASYLLIGYYYTRPSAVYAAKKAFIMNRIGDLGLAAGIWLIWLNFGTVEYEGLFQALAQAGSDESVGGWSVKAIPFLLMLGAFGKSAQLPLYVWLPDAMEGPTPVSALIHAATMVTAGVYLVARMYPAFLLHELALPTVAWVGGLTALLAATIGMAQYDIKRIMAYSTVSQLGYMFMGLGVMTSFGAVYHVFTHAFFKAVLFLTCGAIMHGFAGQLDLRKLSGLRRLPGWKITAWTMFVGCLCLAGVPGSSGYFSKDAILAQAFVTPTPDGAWSFRLLGWLALFTAGLTAYYTFRVWFRVCAGPVHFEAGDEHHGADHEPAHQAGHAGHDAHGGHDHGGDFHPHAPRLAINFVLVALAVGAVLAAIPYFWPAYGDGWIQQMVSHSSAAAGVPSHGAEGAASAAGEHGGSHATLLGFDPHTAMYVVSSVFGLVGIGFAAWLHLLNRKAADALRARLLANPLTRWLPTAMENKWYVDELYIAAIRKPLWFCGHLFALFDRYIIDGVLVDGTARLPKALGRLFQPLQSGALQGYAVTMAGGIGLILAWVVWVWMRGMAL